MKTLLDILRFMLGFVIAFFIMFIIIFIATDLSDTLPKESLRLLIFGVSVGVGGMVVVKGQNEEKTNTKIQNPALKNYSFDGAGTSGVSKAIVFPKWEADLEKHFVEQAGTTKMPSKKKCRYYADGFTEVAKHYISCFYKADSLPLADFYTKKIRDYLKAAIFYEKNAGYETAHGTPSTISLTFENEYQWKLRDAIERAEKQYLSEFKGAQRNNKRACCEQFFREIENTKKNFSEETLDFAMDAYFRVCEIAGVVPQSSGEYSGNGYTGGYIKGRAAVFDVDGMDGHTFEDFCVGLLQKNGFSNVRKTKGSGDQGVDILAEKDDIKYAIQCKCYSSDLGNSPVQEVFAGKNVYHCQVAAVLTNRFFTPGGLEAAKATGVLLWDRRKLQEFIENAGR